MSDPLIRWSTPVRCIHGRVCKVAKRKAYLIRVAPEILNALQHWSDEELGSINAKIKFVLRNALKDRDRS